jgi:cell wall-associated NlpC family hydrolase
MSHPVGLSRRRVQQVLAEAKHDRSTASRIETFSRHFLGFPYKPFPLIGSAGTEEVFAVSLEGFDCVTYVETILALARAATVDNFIEWLRKIRYEDGRIEWKRRNHYMTGWIRNNLREGIVCRVSGSKVPTVSRERLLNVLPGLPAQPTRVKSIPKSAIPRLARFLRNGDLIFFASTRKNLDVFHVGIIVRDNERLLMRHASCSQGGVVEQELGSFLKANRMAGVIVVRPCEVAERNRGGATKNDAALIDMAN